MKFIPVLLLLTLGVPGMLMGQGVVSSASPEASAAGREILEAGGNAIDAAVAVAFSLGVTEPAMSGLGAGIQILMMKPQTDPVVLNGTTFAPARTPPSATSADLKGHRLTTIPTSVRALAHAWRRFGSGRITWPQLLAPAIRHAEQGFAIGAFRHKVLSRHAADLRANPSAATCFLSPDGTIPPEGTIWKQPLLARTLRRLAEHGADDFYRGEIARAIAADMAKHGGWIAAEDLAGLPPPREQAPLAGTFRGSDVFTLPPPAGGWVVLQILNLLERHPASALAYDSPDRDRLVVHALMTGHRNRQQHPVRDMLRHEPETAERISKETAAKLAEKESGETTHFSVVDAGGMAVAVTTSINSYFGAWVVAEGLGFLYNDYMREFERGKPEHPFALKPGAMPLSSMSATIVARNRRPVLAVGSPGSARIISTVSQVVQRWIDGTPIRDAVSAPRLHVVPPARVYIESPDAATGATGWLAPAGFTLQTIPTDLMVGGRNAYFGGVHAVALENGRWTGAADPRRDGTVETARSR